MDLLLGSAFPSQSNICMFVVCNFECNSSNKNVASPAGTNFGIMNPFLSPKALQVSPNISALLQYVVT